MNEKKSDQENSAEVITEYEVLISDESEPEIWPEKYGAVQKKDRKNLILLLILVLVFGLPAAGTVIGAGFSVLTGVISLVVGIFGGLIGLVFSAGAAAVALVGSGVVLIITGSLSMAVPATGVMMIGGGFLLLAVSVLLFILTGWGCGTVIPGFVRFCVGTVKRCCTVIRKGIRRRTGKGGAKEG